MSTNCREPGEKQDALVGQGPLVGIEHDLTAANLKAVRTGIGLALRTLHSEVLHDKLPDRMAEMIRQLDRQTEES
jgi:Anti-sigma factor NepR